MESQDFEDLIFPEKVWAAMLFAMVTNVFFHDHLL